MVPGNDEIESHTPEIQGCLAHKNQPPPLGPPEGPSLGSTEGS